MKKVDFNDTLNTTGIDDVKVKIDVALDLIDKNKDLTSHDEHLKDIAHSLNISDEKELINSIKDELNNEVSIDNVDYSDSEI